MIGFDFDVFDLEEIVDADGKVQELLTVENRSVFLNELDKNVADKIRNVIINYEDYKAEQFENIEKKSQQTARILEESIS